MNIVHAGVIMLAYLVVLILIYMFISGPFDAIMTTFEDINSTASDSHIESSSGYGRTVFDLIFGGLAIVPVLYFVVWVFSREPDWRYRG